MLRTCQPWKELAAVVLIQRLHSVFNWEAASFPGVVLKVWSVDSWGNLRPFQEIHEVPFPAACLCEASFSLYFSQSNKLKEADMEIQLSSSKSDVKDLQKWKTKPLI